ncbi:MAG: T9SS type A sorting domain-containing protein [Bacteroidota bacterium]
MIKIALAAPFRGDGFVLSFMPGGDSTGYTPLSPWGSPCPFVDPSREPIQIKLTYNSSIDNYTMTASNIAEGFYLPVDAELTGNVMYVIENGGDIWKITFPSYVAVPEIQNPSAFSVYPNPFNQGTTLKFENSGKDNCTMTLFNMYGQIIRTITNITTDKIEIERESLSSGLYFLQLRTDNNIRAEGKLIIE